MVHGDVRRWAAEGSKTQPGKQKDYFEQIVHALPILKSGCPIVPAVRKAHSFARVLKKPVLMDASKQ